MYVRVFSFFNNYFQLIMCSRILVVKYRWQIFAFLWEIIVVYMYTFILINYAIYILMNRILMCITYVFFCFILELIYIFFYIFSDYVYFETSSTSPFQIRRIEELNKTPTGNVEAKVMCFYRRRDLPNPLVQLADKHQSEYTSFVSIYMWKI